MRPVCLRVRAAVRNKSPRRMTGGNRPTSLRPPGITRGTGMHACTCECACSYPRLAAPRMAAWQRGGMRTAVKPAAQWIKQPASPRPLHTSASATQGCSPTCLAKEAGVACHSRLTVVGGHEKRKHTIKKENSFAQSESKRDSILPPHHIISWCPRGTKACSTSGCKQHSAHHGPAAPQRCSIGPIACMQAKRRGPHPC